MDARPIIIDCDPGKDDAVALLLAFASPEVEVLAVTAVAGNVPLAVTARNALRVCELAGRADAAVHAGCPRPILKALETAPHVHGKDGLAGAPLPEPAMALRPAHAVDILVDRLMASDGDITLCALGPLTNLALAIVKQPAIVPRIREIVLMGGALKRGNVTPHAEFNIYVDPHAAAVVFGAGRAAHHDRPRRHPPGARDPREGRGDPRHRAAPGGGGRGHAGARSRAGTVRGGRRRRRAAS